MSVLRRRRKVDRRRLLDSLFSRLAAFGGIVLILTILSVFAVIMWVIYPLFKAPSVRFDGQVADVAGPLAVDVASDDGITCIVAENGIYILKHTGDSAPALSFSEFPDGAGVKSVSMAEGNRLLLALTDGRLFTAEWSGIPSNEEGGNLAAAGVKTNHAADLPVDLSSSASDLLISYAPMDTGFRAAVASRNELLLVGLIRQSISSESTDQDARMEIIERSISLSGDSRVTSLAMDERGESVFAGTADGRLVSVWWDETESRQIADPFTVVSEGVAITTLGFLKGGRTLVSGDDSGAVHSWRLIPDAGGTIQLQRIYTYPSHSAPVAAFTSSLRDRSFVTADAAGGLHMSYGTTGETLTIVDSGISNPLALAMTPDADGILAVDKTGTVSSWRVDNPHPGITWRGLLGAVWYEDAQQKEYRWQASGYPEGIEPKYSIVPLIFGTLKGALYTLLFAVPLSVLAALYASQFMPRVLKEGLKPLVEIMAAVPSVVLGFIGGIWLAPYLSSHLFALFLAPVFISIAVVAALLLRHHAPDRFQAYFRPGMEIWVLLAAVLAGGWLALECGAMLEGRYLLDGYGSWIKESLGLTFAERNSIVVGMVMGLAVTPIIFTISEDALSAVPPSFAEGSMSLGATRWQTAVRIVLPAAGSGIISAVLLGFSRAVGETMIILFVSGNVPAMDWSVFSGFRALSASVALETPNVIRGDSLYRVLFFAAFLLLITTFTVNTVAELIRRRLRRLHP